jgi:hypothetical protein
MIRLVLIAEVDTDTIERAQEALDALREVVLPADNYGITLYRAGRDDLRGAVWADGFGWDFDG